MKRKNIERLERMLQPVRFRPSRVNPHPTDGRTPFDSDFARVSLSAPVRRLQDKTQVFPLAEYDFVRNRLTHSIEVMTMARGLGLGVEKMLAEQGLDLIHRDINDPMRNAISKILEVASIVHDLGNPPFGHKGEKAVQNYFKAKDSFVGRALAKSQLTEEELADLQHIEGNVQGFRILRHLALAEDGNSYNLTMPVLATIIKYPFSSTKGNKHGEGAFKKKFGFLSTESDSYSTICDQLGMTCGIRHPLTFLLEAADDITYNACDLEDGFKEGIISIRDIQEMIQPETVNGSQEIIELVSQLSEENEQIKNELLIQKLRIAIQSKMIVACTEEFINKIDAIIEGEYSTSLLDATPYKTLSEKLGDLDKHNFGSEQVQGKEKEGIAKMLYLLDGFACAMILLKEDTDPLAPEFQLYQHISPNYRKAACEPGKIIPATLYRKLLLVTDFIFGMTDGFVLTMYDNEKIGELILRVKCKIDNLAP